jgi:hypothetical protein
MIDVDEVNGNNLNKVTKLYPPLPWRRSHIFPLKVLYDIPVLGKVRPEKMRWFVPLVQEHPCNTV